MPLLFSKVTETFDRAFESECKLGNSFSVKVRIHSSHLQAVSLILQRQPGSHSSVNGRPEYLQGLQWGGRRAI